MTCEYPVCTNDPINYTSSTKICKEHYKKFVNQSAFLRIDEFIKSIKIETKKYFYSVFKFTPKELVTIAFFADLEKGYKV